MEALYKSTTFYLFDVPVGASFQSLEPHRRYKIEWEHPQWDVKYIWPTSKQLFRASFDDRT